MSGTVKISLSYEGIGQLLRGEECRQLVLEKGSAIALSAGEGYECSTHNTGQRQACNVFPATKKASTDNKKNNTLLKCIGG